MRFPGRKELPDSYGGARGQRVESGSDRHGTIDTGNNAYPERVAEARRNWVEARSEDFEQINRRGTLFRDRATNTVYRRLSGCPLLSVGGEATRGASCFIVRGGEIVVLRPASYDPNLYGASGNVYAQELTPSNPGPELRIR